MNVSIIENGKVIWMRDGESGEGVASRGHIKDGTQQKLIAALEESLEQAKSEMLCWDH